MFGIIINKEGYKVAFVVLGENKEPQFYELKIGETIIEKDWQIANAMGKPKWAGTEWIDEEPPKQIDICPTPTIEEQLLATQKMLLSLQEQIIDMA